VKEKLAGFKGRNWLREGLVVMQFAISVALIIGTLIIKDQLGFLQDRNLGFDQERVVVIDRATALGNNYAPFVEQMRNMPEVAAVTSAQTMPGDDFDSSIFVPEQPSNYESSSLVYSFVDYYFPDAMDIKIVAGRTFNPDMATDTAACIINQSAAAKLGWDDPIGKVLSYGGFDDRRIVGVVEDFSFRSLHYEVEPIVLMTTKRALANLAIRLKPGKLDDQLAKLQATWKEFAPQAPMEFSFLDQDFQQLYEKEMRMGQVFGIFSLLAVFIACLGLFGLAAFLTEQRTKEIGIRKILGASVTGLVALLSRDFLRLVLIALLIASPLAWYLMNGWLEDFAYRIDIQWWVFVLAGLLAVGIAFLTVSFQSIKAAMANPVDSLRSE
jgi:putative ABC transport system permease protein